MFGNRYDVKHQHKINDNPKRVADFIMVSRQDKLPTIWIEYDGVQHFQPMRYPGGDKAFLKQQIIDANDLQLAQSLGYKLIRLSYKDFNHKSSTDLVKHIIQSKVYDKSQI